jgi:hypothetical protein
MSRDLVFLCPALLRFLSKNLRGHEELEASTRANLQRQIVDLSRPAPRADDGAMRWATVAQKVGEGLSRPRSAPRSSSTTSTSRSANRPDSPTPRSGKRSQSCARSSAPTTTTPCASRRAALEGEPRSFSRACRTGSSRSSWPGGNRCPRIRARQDQPGRTWIGRPGNHSRSCEDAVCFAEWRPGGERTFV